MKRDGNGQKNAGLGSKLFWLECRRKMLRRNLQIGETYFPVQGRRGIALPRIRFRDLFAAATSKLGFRPKDRNSRDLHRGKFGFEFLQLEVSTESATASQMQPFFQSEAVMRGSPPSVELHIFIAGRSTPAVPHSGRLSRYSELYAEAKRGR